MFRPEEVKSILLIKLRAIGDSVLALPSLAELKRGFPKAKVSVLVPGHSVGLFRQDPRVHEAIVYPKYGNWELKKHVEFYQSLQERHFDLAVCLHASLRTALLGWMSGAPWRSVRNHSGPDWFCNLKAAEPKEPKNIIERDFDALRALGLKPKERRPRLDLGAASKKTAAGLVKPRTLLIFPGAGKPEKRWPMDRFMALHQALKRKGVRSQIVVAPGEPGPAGALRVEDLLTLGAVCARAGFALGNDSGPRHIAVASGARTLTLFGPEELREWHPYEAKQGHLALKPSSGNMADLGLDEVLAAAKKWMKR